MIKAAVLTISDRASKGIYEDESGKILTGALKNIGVEVAQYEVVPDEINLIKEKLIYYSDKLNLNLVLTCGGTGLGPRDATSEATEQILDKKIDGIVELIRFESFKQTKRAALSRAVAGLRGKTLIINFPGSPKAARESFEAIAEIIPHAFEMIEGKGH